MTNPIKSGQIGENQRNEEDQISNLPDELLHKILASIEIISAVQTTVLSKRWEHVWKSLSILSFDEFLFDHDRARLTKFVKHALSNRNQDNFIEKFQLNCQDYVIIRSLVEFVMSVIRQNVHEIDLSCINKLSHLELSCFSSTCLKRLKFVMHEDFEEDHPDITWSLPRLESLHLVSCSLPQSCFDLPALTSLYLRRCKLPEATWCLPVLVTLELRSVRFTENKSDYFSELVNLENLILHFLELPEEVFKISCGKLVNLKISCFRGFFGTFVVTSLKLDNFQYNGAVPITITTSGMNKANIGIKYPIPVDSFTSLPMGTERSLPLLPLMFRGLHFVKFLTLDEGAIKALSTVSDLLAYEPCPFCNLKYVKIPKSFPISTIPSAVKTYLLGQSASTRIVTEFLQGEKDVVRQVAEGAC